MFYIASTEGLPIMRPMWQEFPDDLTTFELSDQFMFGDSILVAPKVKKALYTQNRYFFPQSEDDAGKWWSIDVYLPTRVTAINDTVWYYYGSKLRSIPNLPDAGYLKDVLLENNEYGVYVRGGSILPIKLHNYAQSILRTLLMPVRLDIYLSADRQNAEGLLYLDDGNSFRYQSHKEKALIKYQYSGGRLTCQSLFDKDHDYQPAHTLKITEVNIYGIES
jgi:alpha-glucosidase (family GH31 glycosyl hydrolase)